MELNKELFEAGTLFTTKKNIEFNRKHTYKYIPENKKVVKYFIGIQEEETTSLECYVDEIKENGFEAWNDILNIYNEPFILFSDLIVVD